MNLKEIKKLIKISGGKIILSDGDVKDSFIVMKISDYIKEKEFSCDCDCFEEDDDFDQIDFIEDSIDNSDELRGDLTDEELLDKINSDIEELKKRRQENELSSVVESDLLVQQQKEGELDYEKI